MNKENAFPVIMDKDRQLPFYVMGIGCEEYQNHIRRKAGLPSNQIAICTSGSGMFLVDGNVFPIHTGMAFFLKPDMAHEYYPVKEPWTILWILFDGFGANALYQAMNFDQYGVSKVKNVEEIIADYNHLYQLISGKGSNYMLEASGILYNLLIQIGCDLTTPMTGKITKINEKLDRVIDYIKENFNKEITLLDLADIAGVSSSYLCRIFKQTYQVTPFTYTIQYRICAAKERIISDPEKSIKSIAYETGFSDCSYFGALFRDSVGCSPGEFRMLYTKNR
ncbi:AraC family transcriptional regulator [Clostridium sp. E02]|uniref:AraC family transcriptional regulator n=1 Tax=Clostridium sp. E02 TaxID=2487134 RepID=UPI0013DDB102|nr:AraC family transcriptional regulator [Clostridium sp. E02]